MRLAAVLLGAALLSAAILGEVAVGLIPESTIAANDAGVPCCDGEASSTSAVEPAGDCARDCLCTACDLARSAQRPLHAQLQTFPQPAAGAAQTTALVARLPVEREVGPRQLPPGRDAALHGLTWKMRILRTVVLTT